MLDTQYASAKSIIYAALAKAYAPRKHLTVSEWSDKERRLSKKGSAEPGPWRTDRNPPLREPMDCMSARSYVRDIVLMFPVQFGKALALDTPIPVPGGWKDMSEIRFGDLVFGANGNLCNVIAVSDVFHNHDCYQVTFSDGAKVISDAGHRWSVVDLYQRGEDRKEILRRKKMAGKPRNRTREVTESTESHIVIIETHKLADTIKNRKQSRYAVMLAGAIELPEQDLLIDPYLFGAWLGDGHSHYGAITTMDGEVIRAFACYDPKPHSHQSSGKATTYGLRNNFNKHLRLLGVLKNKHIPVQYLRASKEQRLCLLQGLMDTDGHAPNTGSVEITSSRPQLANGIIELIRSLGFKPTIVWRKTKAADSARITFAAFKGSSVFRLRRHLDSLRDAPSLRGKDSIKMRYIVDIQRVESVPTKCIAVDNDDHLYLCGREFIPTHNTEIAVNALGYTMDHNPGPLMVCLPAQVSQDKWINQKLNPMVEETVAVRNTLTSIKSREAANTRTFKDYLGGQLYIEHAGSPARLKSTSVRTLIVDELDEFMANFTGGDDPVDMLLGRTSAFPATFKRLFISTPQIKGISRTEQMYEKSDQRRFYLACPHCGYEQHLEWAGMQWGADGQNPRYVCKDCGTLGKEIEWKNQILSGRWIAENPSAKMRGYHINGLYYQIGLGPRWEDLVGFWLEAQNDPARLKTFVNDRLAEAWEDPVMRAVKLNIVSDRAESYKIRQAPYGVAAITAGVDTQDNRLAVHIVGWGKGMSAWSLDYIELMGDPASDEVWVALTELLNKPIEHVNGGQLPILATAIDGGGHRTEAVKSYVRSRMIKRPMVIFGAVPNNAPVLSRPKAQDVNWRGRLDKRGVHIQHVGTVAIKHVFYGRLSTDGDKERDKRMLHFSEDFAPEFFSGLTSETYDPRKNRFVNRRGARNEPLDCWVYAYAAAHHAELRLQNYTQKRWDELLLKTEKPEQETATAEPRIIDVKEQSSKTFYIPK